MLNLHLNLILFSLYFIIRQTSSTIFAETPLEELDRLIEEQLAKEKADNSESKFSRYQRNAEQRYCGRKLLQTLNQVCNGCTGPIVTDENNDLTNLNLRRKRDVHEHHEHSRRTKRSGLAEECCRNRCTLDTIKKHCVPC